MPSPVVQELRRGLLRARISRRQTRSGLRYTVAVSRLFKNGETWKESARFGRDDLRLLRLLLDDAHTSIYQHSH